MSEEEAKSSTDGSEATPAVSTKKAAGLGSAPPPSSRRAVSSLRRWTRETFNREQITAGLKQFAWVAPLTILIWIYAEREQRHTEPGIRFPVAVTSNNPKVSVQLIEPTDGVSVDLSGANAQLTKIIGAFGPHMNPVRYEIRDDLKEGKHQIPVSSVIRTDPRFEGLVLAKSEPPFITVLVDALVETTVPVEISEAEKALFDQASFDPPHVRIRLPKTLKEKAEHPDKQTARELVAVADLSTLAGQPPGKRSNIAGIRLYVPGVDSENLTIEPSTVSVSLNVRERARKYSLKHAIVVHEDVPNQLREEKVSVLLYPRLLSDVEVSGPPELIAPIEANDGQDIEALVQINSTDVLIAPQPFPRAPRFITPEGVKVISKSEPILVTVKPKASNTP